MRVSQHILDEAVKILQQQADLPQQISSAPNFYVARARDHSIHAVTVIKHEGIIYKIGAQKDQ